MSAVVAIVGSRSWPDLRAVRAFVRKQAPTTLIVSGGAKGVDQEAIKVADALGYPTKVFAANWEEHGKRAGFLRNKALVDFLAERDGRLVAFHANDPKTSEPSRGTAMTIGLARDAGVKVTIYRHRGDLEPEEGETPIPERIADLIAAADAVRKRLGGTTVAQGRRQLAGVLERHAITLHEELADLDAKLTAGWDWLGAHPGHDLFAATEEKWFGFWRAYEAVVDCLVRLEPELRAAGRVEGMAPNAA